MADTKTASLTVLGGPLAGAQCVLPESGTLTIGSSPGSSLYLDLPAVSPFHARVLVEEGQTIEAGEVVVVLEAMKMETEITAPQAGTVSAVLVSPGTAVTSGQVLLQIT